MEGNYQPGFYCTERDQQENRQQQQQQQQQQQHVVHYPMDLPYHTASQHQTEFGVDQPLRLFTAPFAGAHMFQQSPVTVRCQQSLNLSASSHVPAIATHEPVTERNHLVVETCEPVVESSIPSATNCEPIVRRNNLPVPTHEATEKGNVPQSQGQTAIAPIPSAEVQHDGQREQCQNSSHQNSTNPTDPEVSTKEPQLCRAPNLKKNSTVSYPCEGLPQSLSFKSASQDKVEGVVAKETIEKGVEFGPYTGTLMNEEQGWSKDTTWEICISDRVHFYIDGCKTWMSHLRCARSEEEQNMEAYQYYGKVYFRSTKVIEPGSELRVFYSEEYREHVGIQTQLKDLMFNQDAQKFQCSLCEGLFTSTKLILRHIRYEHTNGQPDEMISIQTMKQPKKKSAGIEVSFKQPVKKGIEVSLKQPHKKGTEVSLKQPLKKRKRASNLKDSVFKCDTCDKVFSSYGKLKAHEMFHEYSPDHTCPVCGKRQRNAQTWAKHMMLHKPEHEPRPHKCNECNGRYTSKVALRKHENHIHGYPCRFCKERFSKKKDCLKHELTHQSYLTSHSDARTLPSATPTPVAEPAPDEPQDMLGKTATYYLKERPFKCRFCPKTYLTRNTVSNHEKDVHFGYKPFTCNHCSKSFSKESVFLKHLKTHEQNRTYRCTLCPRTFRSESAFNNHQGEHNGLKPFKCELCGRGFRVRKAVCQHKRHVHRERPMRFFCTVCNKGFADKGNLIKHERRHKGIRPFVCTECGKAFTAKSSLTTHMQSLHTTEKPYSCEICGKTFSLNDRYTFHLFKHKLQGDENVGNGIQQ